MSTYSAVANSEIAVGAPLTNSLKTKERDNLLAIQENDASAPTIAYATLAGSVSADSVAPSTDLIDTITTEGTQNIGATSSWTPPQGFFNMTAETSVNAARVDLYISAAWKAGKSSVSGVIFCDGTNMRLTNSVATAYDTYWQRFDG